MKFLSTSLIITVLAVPKVTLATYSIAATDKGTRQIGAAGASCVQNDDIGAVLYHGVPDHGVLITQALPLTIQDAAVTTALGNITQDMKNPTTILQDMNNLDVVFHGYRQNAIVNLKGEQHAWTGPELDRMYMVDMKIFGTVQESDGDTIGNYTYSAQGNVVTPGTVTTLSHAFEGQNPTLGTGCDLAARLMIAMKAVSQTTGAGDKRCLDGTIKPLGISGTPAAGAFLKVQLVNGTYLVNLNVTGDGKVDPTIELERQYNAWRSSHGCPP